LCLGVFQKSLLVGESKTIRDNQRREIEAAPRLPHYFLLTKIFYRLYYTLLIASGGVANKRSSSGAC
jgi:hypothetical protein